jgi:tRNA-splicing ligase RtcB
MIKVIDEHRIPIYSWCDTLEQKTLEQASNLANHPTMFHHVALMPDAHMGYGMPIGGVIAVKNAIIPYAVGSDIGCGMGFIQTNIPISVINDPIIKSKPLRRHIRNVIDRVIPTGFGHHKKPQICPMLDNVSEDVYKIPIVKEQIEKAYYQVGTLGSGNHFVELQKDSNEKLCIMLHSGSRNVGYTIAKHYNELAIKMTPELDPKIELNYLNLDSDEGNEYLTAMNFALDFALESRKHMMEKVKNVVLNLIDKHTDWKGTKFLKEVNIHHNFAIMEEHFGELVMVHRKGATQAFKNQLGIIPGSMGTNSYIVKGKGNPDSFMSCSHGAGRIMGRNEFNRTHLKEECTEAMRGIDHGHWKENRKAKNGKYDLSESPQAYKDIDKVIENEKDLVDVVIKLRPIASVKG